MALQKYTKDFNCPEVLSLEKLWKGAAKAFPDVRFQANYSLEFEVAGSKLPLSSTECDSEERELKKMRQVFWLLTATNSGHLLPEHITRSLALFEYGKILWDEEELVRQILSIFRTTCTSLYKLDTSLCHQYSCCTVRHARKLRTVPKPYRTVLHIVRKVPALP